MQILHTAFRVTDLDASRAFYLDGWGPRRSGASRRTCRDASRRSSSGRAVRSCSNRLDLGRSEVEFESHRNVVSIVEDPDGHAIELIERLEGPPG